METLYIDFMISIKFSSTISTVQEERNALVHLEHKIAEFLEKILIRKTWKSI